MVCRPRLRRLIMRPWSRRYASCVTCASHVGQSAGATEWISVDEVLIEGFGRLPITSTSSARPGTAGRQHHRARPLLALIPGLPPQLMRAPNHHSALNYGFRVGSTSVVPIESLCTCRRVARAGRGQTAGDDNDGSACVHSDRRKFLSNRPGFAISRRGLLRPDVVLFDDLPPLGNLGGQEPLESLGRAADEFELAIR